MLLVYKRPMGVSDRGPAGVNGQGAGGSERPENRIKRISGTFRDIGFKSPCFYKINRGKRL